MRLYLKQENKNIWFSAQNRYNYEKLNLKRSVFEKDQARVVQTLDSAIQWIVIYLFVSAIQRLNRSQKCFIWLSWRFKPQLKLLGHVVGLLKSLNGWWLIYSSTVYFTEHFNKKGDFTCKLCQFSSQSVSHLNELFLLLRQLAYAPRRFLQFAV